MTHQREGDTVTLTMTIDDWECLLFMLGRGAGMAARDSDKTEFWRWVRLANEVCNGNPNFTPYEIPEEFSERRVAL